MTLHRKNEWVFIMLCTRKCKYNGEKLSPALILGIYAYRVNDKKQNGSIFINFINHFNKFHCSKLKFSDIKTA